MENCPEPTESVLRHMHWTTNVKSRSIGRLCIEAKLAAVSRDSITVELNTGEKFVLPLDRYGYFRFCTIAELEHVTCDGVALEWPEAMIDLELNLLRHPDKEGTPTPVNKWLAFQDALRKKSAIRVSPPYVVQPLGCRM